MRLELTTQLSPSDSFLDCFPPHWDQMFHNGGSERIRTPMPILTEHNRFQVYAVITVSVRSHMAMVGRLELPKIPGSKPGASTIRLHHINANLV